MNQLLRFTDVELYYDHVYALKGVSLELNEGETVALIGANGAGKSSILRAITGLKKIRQGEVLFDGVRIDQGFGPDAIVKMGVAMVPEGRRVFPYMSVKDNLLMGAFTRTDKAGIQGTLEMVLGRFPRLKERYSQHRAETGSGHRALHCRHQPGRKSERLAGGAELPHGPQSLPPGLCAGHRVGRALGQVERAPERRTGQAALLGRRAMSPLGPGRTANGSPAP
jgi:ABC-type branched-subunit amino acid transport system ATPase component